MFVKNAIVMLMPAFITICVLSCKNTFSELSCKSSRTFETRHRGDCQTLVSYVGENKYIFTIRGSDFIGNPKSCLTNFNVKTLGNVILRAREQCNGYLPESDLDKWYVKEIRIQCYMGQKDWYYVVDFRPKKPSIKSADFLPTEQLRIPILINGNVIHGRREDYKIRVPMKNASVGGGTSISSENSPDESVVGCPGFEEYTSSWKNKRIRFVVDGGALSNIDIAKEPLPLLPLEVVQAAKYSMQKYQPDVYTQWSLSGLGIVRFKDSSKWYYTVDFQMGNGISISTGVIDQVRVPVLQNGEAVNGIVEVVPPVAID